MTGWLLAFALTQLIEAPIYTWALRRAERPWLSAILIALGASAITHPFVWFAFPALIDHDVIRLVVSELFAYGVEFGWLALFRVPRAWLWAAAANGASFGFGLVLSLVLGWP